VPLLCGGERPKDRLRPFQDALDRSVQVLEQLHRGEQADVGALGVVLAGAVEARVGQALLQAPLGSLGPPQFGAGEGGVIDVGHAGTTAPCR